MERHSNVIVIPAYNEERTISKIINKAKTFGNVIVVDDGSIDKTVTVSENSGAFVVRHNRNKGYEAALETGLNEAKKLKCEQIITMDADGQHDAKLIEKFIEKQANGAHLTVGIRSKKNRFSENIFGFYSNLRFGVKDPLCGMKAYSLELLLLADKVKGAKMLGTGILFWALLSNKTVAQVDILVGQRVGSARIGGHWRANLSIMLTLLLWLRQAGFKFRF